MATQLGEDRDDRAPGAIRPLQSRLRPPGAHVELVVREALVERLRRTEAPLILVSAPAGYGETTALAQWAGTDGRPAAWLQLDAADDDPVVFLTYLASALMPVTPLEDHALGLLRRQTPPIDELVLPAITAAASAATPVLLVLDDGHLLRNPACWRYVAKVHEHLAPGASLCVASRSSPPLPLGKLRAGGGLAEFGASDLAMDRAETAALLVLREITPSVPVVDALMEATEGWPAGLSLSLLARTRHPSGDWPAGIHGEQRAVAAFLTEEVLDRQPPKVQSFLLRTSVLERLSPGLCRSVAGDDRAGERLAALARDGLFVVPLDDAGEWYRYHHLFGELLATLQKRRAPQELPGLHRRAADWCLAHDDRVGAVRHLTAAGDVAGAARPAFIACLELVDCGQAETARLLLDGFSEEQLAAHTALTFAAAYVYGTALDAGAKGERWRRAACSLDVGDEEMPEGRGPWRAFQDGLRAFLAPDGVGRMLADAEHGASLDIMAGAADRSEGQRVLGVAHYLNGHPRRCRAAFEEMLAVCDDTACCSYALGFLSLLAADEERRAEAAELDERALGLTPTMTLDHSPGMFLALPMLLAHARVLAHADDPGAGAALARAERYRAAMVPQVAWRLLLIDVVLGEVQLERGETAEAERWARSAEALLKAGPDAGMLAGRVKRLRAALEALRMTEPLSAAERRVLELLPTQLTARQIATRLFVSESTVKSHMSHIYRKLGVTARTGAVEQARELGLL